MRELASCREHTATTWPPSLVTPSGGLILLLLLNLLIFDNCHETAPVFHSLRQAAMRRTTIGSLERLWENSLCWQLSWESLPDSFLFKAVLRGTLKGPPHTTSWENSIPLNNFFLFTQLYDIREHIGVFLYICWNHPHDNALPFSTPTIFFYTNTRSNFDLYCSPPPLTPLILLTLTLTSVTSGNHNSTYFISLVIHINTLVVNRKNGVQ